MLYTLRFFFSSKCSLFHNANLFGSCIIHILYTVCVKIKKNNSGGKGLIVYIYIYKGLNRLILLSWNDKLSDIYDSRGGKNTSESHNKTLKMNTQLF